MVTSSKTFWYIAMDVAMSNPITLRNATPASSSRVCSARLP